MTNHLAAIWFSIFACHVQTERMDSWLSRTCTKRVLGGEQRKCCALPFPLPLVVPAPDDESRARCMLDRADKRAWCAGRGWFFGVCPSGRYGSRAEKIRRHSQKANEDRCPQVGDRLCGDVERNQSSRSDEVLMHLQDRRAMRGRTVQGRVSAPSCRREGAYDQVYAALAERLYKARSSLINLAESS